MNGKIIARNELAVLSASWQKIREEDAPPAGQHEDVFGRDHVNPRRVLLVPTLLSDVLVEAIRNSGRGP